MLGEKHVRTLLEGALAWSKAGQTEVVLVAEESALTRFANNAIHQNVAEKDVSLRVRAVVGKKIGVSTTNQLDAAAVREAVRSAAEIAKFQEENPDFVSLPSRADVQPVHTFADATAASTPEQRARSVLSIIRQSEQDKLNAAGAHSTSVLEVGIANSLGVSVYHAMTAADVNAVVMGETGSGYADRAAVSVADVDFEQVGKEACSRALRSANPRTLEPGSYEVVLEPYAVAEMLELLGYVGFGALQFQEGRSFMAEQLGKEVADPKITIYDDGLDERCFGVPFDFEGVPKQRVDLIAGGIAKSVVYDSYTANRAKNQKSTGHALPAPNMSGPLPGHLHLQAGDFGTEEMVASMEQGIWVTRFHYVNVLHPLETIITGMTRDGTFWVEKGEVQYPIKNLRFSQSILGALRNVGGIGRALKLQRGWFGGTLVPALRLREFRFTGKTEF